MTPKRRIKALKLSRVDFVRAGANQMADVLLTKSATIPIVKVANEEQRIAVAWANVAAVDGQDVIDLQGDSIGIDVLEKAVHDFALEGGGVGLNHDGGPLRGRIVESFVTSADKQKALGISGIPEGWIVAIKVDDEQVWQQVRRGELKMLSIEGRADVESVGKSDYESEREAYFRARLADIKAEALAKHRVRVTIESDDYGEAPGATEDGIPRSQSTVGPLSVADLYPAGTVSPAVNKAGETREQYLTRRAAEIRKGQG